MLGQYIPVIVPPDRREELAPVLDRLRQGRRVSPFETRRVRNDGVIIDVSVRISLIRDALGAVTRAAAVIAKSSDNAIIGTTADGMITSWNPAAEHLAGYTAAEVAGQIISARWVQPKKNYWQILGSASQGLDEKQR